MSIRVTALLIVVAFLSVYAWKDWFSSLCGLILLMAVIEHEDMPTFMFGIQGLNVWNILFAIIFLAWIASRRNEGLTWDMPRHINVLLLMYLAVILVGFLRAVSDRHGYIQYYPLKDLIAEELINTIKWVLPGILLFDGCRTRRRLVMVLFCLLAMYFLISLQVIKRMPFESALSGGGRIPSIRLKICRSIGYSAVDMSTFLAGASWGILLTVQLFHRKKHKVLVLLAAGTVAFGQALTGGRAGYVAWAAIGLGLCMLKWRKYLILAPVIVMLLPIVLPGSWNRMVTGFGKNMEGDTVVDQYAVTSGRTLIWPYVIEKIGEAPIIGYGRLGMRRTGLAVQLRQELRESFPHPHNMYLETLLDNGILGSIPIIIFWILLVIYSAKLLRSDNRLCSAVGGVALSLILAQLIAGIGSQHFYPKESTLGAWAAIFLCIRVYVEQDHMRIVTKFDEGTWKSQGLRQQQIPIYIP